MRSMYLDDAGHRPVTLKTGFLHNMNHIAYSYLRGFLSLPLVHLKCLQILTTPFTPELIR